jgi:putative transcriptional regulator
MAVVLLPPRGEIDARSIRREARRGIGYSQQAFANMLGIRVKTLRNWEQRRRQPTGAARVLLWIMARDPWIVFDVMHDQHRTPLA